MANNLQSLAQKINKTVFNWPEWKYKWNLSNVSADIAIKQSHIFQTPCVKFLTITNLGEIPLYYSISINDSGTS